MIYHNLCGWNGIPDDCTEIIGGNLSGVNFPIDRPIFVDEVIIPEGDYPANITFGSKCVFVKPVPAQEPELDMELSSQAIIVYNALKGRGQLTPEQDMVLQQIVGEVNQVAGTTVELGVAATGVVEQMIAKLQSNGQSELAGQIYQMLISVQAGWRAE